jgi:2'-5' RNA ligase
MVAGPAADFSSDQIEQMAKTATELLAHTPPTQVTLGRVLYHPEAVMLAVTPAQALTPIREAAQRAIRSVTGQQVSNGDAHRWAPHVTICYSTADQPAQPIIAALGRQLPECDLQINAVSLVIQHGPERRWDWSNAATISLAAAAK